MEESVLGAKLADEFVSALFPEVSHVVNRGLLQRCLQFRALASDVGALHVGGLSHVHQGRPDQ